MSTTRIQLQHAVFSDKETVFVEHGSVTASVFRYERGVCGVRLTNQHGHLILLPFQGQQIWECQLADRNLTMKSMFSQPNPTQEYLATYGAFLVHCGATAMGVPSQEDSHPLHGELPNAPYTQAYLLVGEDERGTFLGLGGQYEYTIAFNHHYLFEPCVKFYADSTVFPVSATLTNLKNTDMEYMYMAHVNFRPQDQGRIVYSAPCTPESTRVSINVPAHIKSSHPIEDFRVFLNLLKDDPAKHTVLTPDLLLDPEVIFFIDYLADEDGFAHSMHVHPDGYAGYLKHRLAELDRGVRWICRTPDQDALGLFLPATAEHQGYTAEKTKGHLKVLPAGASVEFFLETGLLPPEEAQKMEHKIQKILSFA
ncbi:DUF4432 family protein [candidate division KSB3 bacterium]|uniref:DUF4432 family protein n=1 Tax=candidate division KSB3 bacterium TaxID=2044937 RepID=A0A9D5JTQ1_9BACT|nr:DUF4432 family protein [candidate division KSB3 bacterium]MBD3324047.1 DUF4432 family protein [candidate division KSB3 bacterium]